MEYTKEDFENTIEYLKKKYPNIQTYCNYISSILVNIRNEVPVNEPLQLLYRTELKRCKQIIEDLPKDSFDISLQLEKLRDIWYKRNIIDRHGLIIGLYLFLPALRSDYAESFIKDNLINITLSKINKGSVITREIPPELTPFLHLYKNLPSRHNTFTNAVAIASRIIFDRTITINVFRRIWTEFGLRTMTVSEQRNLAYNMNHSFEIHNRQYTPQMQIVYK